MHPVMQEEDFDLPMEEEEGDKNVTRKQGRGCSMNRKICENGQQLMNGLRETSKVFGRNVNDNAYAELMRMFEDISNAFPDSQLLDGVVEGRNNMSELETALDETSRIFRGLNSEMRAILGYLEDKSKVNGIHMHNVH